MKHINDLLPYAMKALKDSGLVFPDNSILKEYDGYVASFAPSVITAGLRATLSFYSDKHKDNEDGKPRRNHVLDLLHKIYQDSGGALAGPDLLTIALRQSLGNDQLRRLKRDLMNASVALKLAMRNFKQVDKAPNLTNTTPDNQTQAS